MKTYDDLAKKRFVLIVSEPHHRKIKTPDDKFGEENNSWVQYVSIPLLCYYEPYLTLKQFNIQLLVPQNNISDCPWFTFGLQYSFRNNPNLVFLTFAKCFWLNHRLINQPRIVTRYRNVILGDFFRNSKRVWEIADFAADRTLSR